MTFCIFTMFSGQIMLSAMDEPPLSLKRRLRLGKLEVWIRVATVSTLHKASGADLATGKVRPELTLSASFDNLQALRSFVDRHLQDLRRLHQKVVIPRVGNWCLEREDSSRVVFDDWDPERENGSALTVEHQNVEGSLLMRFGFGQTQEPTLASPGIWQIMSEHVLVVVTKSRWSRINKKTKRRAVIGTYDMLVSKDCTLGHLLKEAGAVTGSWVQMNDAKIEDSEFLSQDRRSVRSVDWAHGTAVHIVIQ